MCGIAGIIFPERGDAIYKMVDALSHRGPDERGYYHDPDDHMSLGQCRLSIIDLSHGKQPISNETGSLYLICNGEIYNSPELRKELISLGHTFKTSTDVEVILHLYEEYGKECVKYLRGMFAFAIWNRDDKTLFLARDHMGQKPLFFYTRPGIFIFASEIKGIFASGLVDSEIDLEGLWHYVSLRFIPDRYSLFKNIQKLPAASWVFIENGKIISDTYWTLDFKNKLPNKEGEIEEELNSILLDTVKIHLLSDVRVGSFLSGGIDSSTITAMMATITGEPIPTFSIGVKEQSFNELPYARMVVDKYGLEAHERVVQADIIRLMPSMINHMDEPSDPFGIGVYLVSKVASEFVKVVLGGDGGDENFAGYDRFAGNKLVDYYCLFPEWFRKMIMKRIIKRIPETFSYKSFAQKAAWINEMSLFTHGERYGQSLSFLRFTQEAKQQLFTKRAREQIEDYDTFSKVLKYFESENVDHLVDKMLYTDLMTRMPDHLLVIVDRMAMAHSLESRSPLIDYKVVEFAASIPAELKLKGKNLKYILKKVARRYLPQELIYRKKQGFGFPLGIWMRTDLKKFISNLFEQSRFVEHGIFNETYVKGLMQEHISGRFNHEYRLWILINLEIWYQLYIEGKELESVENNIKNLL
jgi:asparagine synthase (glutamine-hydrolysing)